MRVWAITVAILCLPVAATAQSISRFSARRTVIAAEARVVGSRVRPVIGLAAGDFRLKVDGLACPRLSAEWVATNRQRASQVMRKDHLARTNEPASRTAGGLAHEHVVFLLDFVNTSALDRRRLLPALSAYLRAAPIFGENVALMQLEQPQMLVPFTSDPREIIQALAGFNPLAAHGDEPPDDFQYDPRLAGTGPLAAGAWRQLALLDHVRAETTLTGFRDLARVLSSVSGQKIVIWLTSDASALNPSFINQFSLGDPSEEPYQIPRGELHETFGVLNAADLSIWPVQIRGQSNPGLPEAASSVPARAVDKLRQIQEDRAGDARLAMFTMAGGTGGQTFEGDNGLVDLLRRAFSLLHGYYLLSCPFTFEPVVPSGHALRDGRLLLAPGYHSLKVRVVRRGAKVLARRSVFISNN